MATKTHGVTRELRATIATREAAYAANDAIDVGNELANAGRGVITDVVLTDLDEQDAALDLFFYKSEPTAEVDGDPFSEAAADAAKCIGVIQITAGDYIDLNTGSRATVYPPGVLSYDTDGRDNSLWVQVVVRGAPDYTAGNNLDLKVGVLKDK